MPRRFGRSSISDREEGRTQGPRALRSEVLFHLLKLLIFEFRIRMARRNPSTLAQRAEDQLVVTLEPVNHFIGKDVYAGRVFLGNELAFLFTPTPHGGDDASAFGGKD